MNYTNNDNDMLVEMNTGTLHQTLTPVTHGGFDTLNYGSMGDVIMDTSCFNTDSMNLQSNFDSMTLFPATDISQQHVLPQEPQSISMDQFGSSGINTTMHITSAPVVKSQASLVKTEGLWSPPTGYNAPPIHLPTGVTQSWSSMNGNNNGATVDQVSDHFVSSVQHYQQQHDQQSDTTSTQWRDGSSFSPSYQDMLLSDVYPTPSPVPTSMVPHYNKSIPQEDIKPPAIAPKKAGVVRRSLPRRHTVSSVYNAPPNHSHNGMIFWHQQSNHQQHQPFHHQHQHGQQQQQQQQQDLTQQAKMRKMLKARRHRSLGRLEVSGHYLTKLDTAYHAASPSSMSCGTSRCGSPLSAECLFNEQQLDQIIHSTDQPIQRLTHPPYLSQQQQQPHYQHQTTDEIDSVSSYPSFLVQPIYQTSPPMSTTTSVPSAPMMHLQQNQHPVNLQMMDDDLYSMAATSHTSTNTAPTSPVLMPPVDDESDPDDYGQQLGQQQDTSEPHTCQWGDCRLEFQVLDHLIEHTKTLHIGSGKPLYYCRWKDCARGEKPFTKRHKMHNHLRTHTGERPYVCTEEGCGKRFSRPDSMATHTKIHTNIRPHACQHENCDKAYYHLRSLRKHEKSHEIPPPLPTTSLMDRHLSVLELKD